MTAKTLLDVIIGKQLLCLGSQAENQIFISRKGHSVVFHAKVKRYQMSLYVRQVRTPKQIILYNPENQMVAPE